MCPLTELPRPDRLKVLAEQAVARKKTDLQVSQPSHASHSERMYVHMWAFVHAYVRACM